jgi:hypothetical protein
MDGINLGLLLTIMIALFSINLAIMLFIGNNVLARLNGSQPKQSSKNDTSSNNSNVIPAIIIVIVKNPTNTSIDTWENNPSILKHLTSILHEIEHEKKRENQGDF